MKIEPPNWADIAAAMAAIVAAITGVAAVALHIQDRFRQRPFRAWASWSAQGPEGLVMLRLGSRGDTAVKLTRIRAGRGFEVCEAEHATDRLGHTAPGPPGPFGREADMSAFIPWEASGGTDLWLYVRPSRRGVSPRRAYLWLSFSIFHDDRPTRSTIKRTIVTP